jgi:hypothetical protein
MENVSSSGITEVSEIAQMVSQCLRNVTKMKDKLMIASWIALILCLILNPLFLPKEIFLVPFTLALASIICD